MEKEGGGDYVGKRIEVMGEIRDEMKGNVKVLGKKYKLDLVIREMGGRVGEMECVG